ncbi:MAG: hypothetical protein V4616_01885 [Bacteroidota bacterium]
MNRRDLKKKINHITERFADHCLDAEQAQPKKSAEINDLIDQTAELVDDVMHEIGKTSEFVGKEVKAHYSRLYKDFDDRMEALEKKLTGLKG